ncbi:MAG: tetratricopeptide repeat protein [Leptospirales bacterium]
MSYRIRKKSSERNDAQESVSRPSSTGAQSGSSQVLSSMMEKKRNPIVVGGVVGLVLLAGAGLVAHIYSDKKKAEQNAATIETKAEQLFSQGMQDKKVDMNKVSSMFETVVKKYPDSSSAKVAPLFLASIQNQMGHPQDAVQWLHTGLEKNAGDTKILPFYYESLGVTFMSSKQFDQALAMFQKVIKFPGKILADAAYYNIGKVYEDLNQPALAILNYRKLQKKFPNSPWAAEANTYINKQNPMASPSPPSPPSLAPSLPTLPTPSSPSK